MDGLKDLSQIEQLKILKSIRLGCSNEAEFELYVKNHLGEDGIEEVIRRIDGLLLEDEFLLLCKLMKACFAINGLEQGFVIDNGLKVPDYLAVFDLSNSMYKTEYNPTKISALVEVKTTQGDKIKLGKNFLDKYAKYADLHDLPLIIASRFQISEKQQWWILQTKNQFIKYNRIISIQQIVDNGIGHVLLNDYFIMPTTDIFIKTEFSNTPLTSHTHSKEYGYLKSVTITFDEKQVTLPCEYPLLNLFLDCFFHEHISVVQNNDGVTVRRVMPVQAQLLSDMVLRANFSMLDGNGDQYSSASRLLALLENNKATVIGREFFDEAMNFFNSEFLLFKSLELGDEVNNQKLIKQFHNKEI
ncbi:hypothetical protein [Shewanella baltica]|uniref:hypothetical protein n=1 Tax=Shewanella baltica TaxID=62322 RepID=UPI00217D1582|nr:hypothetical protein [Shewanella baltica]MCS6174492.1 hypothetical protein [Shewanella baltica]